MKVELYKITCLTNMHVGNGDVNFNIIDNEVQRDPVTNLPTINSSGIKGALREYFSELNRESEEIEQSGEYRDILERLALYKDEDEIEYNIAYEEWSRLKGITKEESIEIFGPEQNENNGGSRPGILKFLSGNLLALPMRASGGNVPFYRVTTKNVLSQFIELLQLENQNNLEEIENNLDNLDSNVSYKINTSETSVEGKRIEEVVSDNALKLFLQKYIGENTVIMKETDIKKIDLPVMARNYLVNGESKNLWYEEIVPHHSIFYFTVITNNLDSKYAELFKVAVNEKIVQFGGNASIGYGYTKVEKL